MFFFILFLCSLIFAASASASVTIQGESTPYNVSIGDTLSVTSRKSLQVGENFVKWEIVSGTGTFVDETEDSTGFIPSSDPVVIRRVTRTLPIYEISDKTTKFIYGENSSVIPLALYGVRTYFNSNEGGQFLVSCKFQQSTTFLNFYGDSTFKTFVPIAPSDSFVATRDCFVADGYRKCLIKVQPNINYHFFFYAAGYPDVNMKDSIVVRVDRAYTLEASYSGNGTAYVDSLHRKAITFNRVISTDTTKIYAIPGNDNLFDHWEVVSGQCSILDRDKDTSGVIGVKSDCKVRAVFRAGTVYPITGTPTQYNFKDHLYAKQASSGSAGVRFTFTAPSAGTYAIVVSNETTQDSAMYIRYTSTGFATAATTKKFLGTYSEPMNLTAGQEVAIVVANTGSGANPFYINYATQAYRVTLGTDGNGKALPAGGYATAYAGSRYSISAEANAGYRFSDWQTVSGTPAVEDKNAPYTYVTVNGNAELKANFKASTVYTLTRTKQKFNHQDNYYSEPSLSAIRFTWTPPDTGSYMVSIEAVDPVGGIFTDYGTDKNFSTPVTARAVFGSTTSFTVRGTPGVPLYWTFQDSSSGIPNKSFNAWVSSPYVLTVISSKEGAAYPSGKVYTAPGNRTILTAWPHGGYKFKSWVSTVGDLDIESPNESRTIVVPKDSVCTVKATFTVDPSAEPSLSISKLDLGSYPEVCAVVSVTDKNSGNSFYGLVSDDFTLTQDGVPIKPQVTSINNVTGVSVVIVVDESGSMIYNDRMEKAKASIQSFVNDMGPYDRISIVGFRGDDSTVVHLAMTSDKSLIVKAVKEVDVDMNAATNIIVGTYVGVEQIVNETNPTAVIVFSDGVNNGGSKTLKETVALAKSKNTTIYSIGLETDAKYPLEDLAVNTGGTFTFASDASELGGIYASIRNSIMSQYMVCYQTPDTVQNGETHTVAISTKLNKITTSDTARWSENSLPPIITLTEATKELTENSQPSNLPLTVGVYIRTLVGIASADIYLRTSGSSDSYARYSMRNVRDSLWEFTVPANLVVSPGLDFFVIASDLLGQAGYAPRTQMPSREPYTIFVDNDIPAVETVSAECKDSTSDVKTFAFGIKDSDGIGSATLFYRDSRAIIFREAPLAHSADNDTWTVSIPANERDYDMVFYYLRVTDAKGASVRSPREGTLSTSACRVSVVDGPAPVDSAPGDSVLPPSPRDSVVYSLIADIAEMYDKDLDGRADFVRVHFKEERDDNITSIDSIFWNSNRGEWRHVPAEDIRKSRDDGEWFEGYINKPYKYGLTKADSAHPPFLAFTSVHSDGLENVKLLDRVGAVPVKASKNPGRVGLKEYMEPDAEMPPDTLIVRMSEPVKNAGDEAAWEKLFRYSESCKDTVSQPLKLRTAPSVRENGLVWTLILDGYSLKAGSCLSTDPSAAYEDLAGNAMGRGGIEIDGRDGSFYLGAVVPVKPVSGIGKTPKWIPPEGSDWEPLPDSLSAVSVKTSMPYKAEVYIFDGIGTYVTDFRQKFGYDGEMEQSSRGGPGSQFKQGYLHWNQRSDRGRKAGTGIYIWKILFTFDDGHKETRIVKTGIYRRGHKKK
ncbi:MAG: VWA domain-containing protein [Fibrobacter sp.]|uniref:InlB B-repeat-containing protein n=1 Tax=Fibrobacter sp. TaxID=35828 RepID=UPI001B2DBF67|nr:VWA domain-containing protein [Fibrobacter sp.]MBO7061761.1 VWA domain-containing protein [Fibrobacter sp.]